MITAVCSASYTDATTLSIEVCPNYDEQSKRCLCGNKTGHGDYTFTISANESFMNRVVSEKECARKALAQYAAENRITNLRDPSHLIGMTGR